MIFSKDDMKIAIVAPSSSMSDLPERFVGVGLQRMKELGFSTVFGKSVYKKTYNTAGSINDRVTDIHDAFLNPDISAIMAIYGGYNSTDLLEHLDYDLIASHKKLFIGYSDITALLNALYFKAGLVTIHGPGFASFCNPNMLESCVESFKSLIFGSASYTLSSPDYAIYDKWYIQSPLSRINDYPQPKWRALKYGTAQGVLIGGNIDTLLALAGTEFFPKIDNCILMLESVADDSPGKLQRGLMQLRHMKVFSFLRGVIFGLYPPNNELSQYEVISHILKEATQGYDFPIMLNVNCSHVDPLFSLPIGGRVEMNCTEPCSITVLDPINNCRGSHGG